MSKREEFALGFLEAIQEDCSRIVSFDEEQFIPPDLVKKAGYATQEEWKEAVQNGECELTLTNMQLVIAQMRERRPDIWFRMLGTMVPKQLEVTVGATLVSMLEDVYNARGKLPYLDPYALPGSAVEVQEHRDARLEPGNGAPAIEGEIIDHTPGFPTADSQPAQDGERGGEAHADADSVLEGAADELRDAGDQNDSGRVAGAGVDPHGGQAAEPAGTEGDLPGGALRLPL